MADDLESAVRLSPQIRRYVPRLDAEMDKFETANDQRFEAARIVLENPAFSPRMAFGARRIQRYVTPIRPAPDYVALSDPSDNWWCVVDRDDRRREHMDRQVLAHPRFAHYSAAERAEIGKVSQLGQETVAEAFGPHIVRYARDHPGDPRVPRLLHRVVFATRHACGRGPGWISQQAYACSTSVSRTASGRSRRPIGTTRRVAYGAGASLREADRGVLLLPTD